MHTCFLRAWGIAILFAVVMSGCASLAPRRAALPMSVTGETPITGAFVHPLPGSRCISLFGRRGRKMHRGVDLKKNAHGGDIVVAARAGTVTMARRCRGYGLLVDILHVNGSHTRYAHLQRILVKKHQQVDAGQRIGIVGTTGNATTPHLHFEMRTMLGHCIDPTPYLQSARSEEAAAGISPRRKDFGPLADKPLLR